MLFTECLDVASVDAASMIRSISRYYFYHLIVVDLFRFKIYETLTLFVLIELAVQWFSYT